MKVYVPGVHDTKQVKTFEVQSVPIFETDLDIVTGNVNNEIYDSCFVAFTIARTNNLLPKNQRMHIHFTDYELLKSGPSAGLGVLLKIFLTNNTLDINLMVTGEIDLSGNVLEVGGFQEKLEYFCEKSSNFEYFIFPASNCRFSKDVSYNFKMKPISHISEIRGIIDEIITDNLYNKEK